MRFERLISALDYHTEGEPFRIVTAGIPAIPGATMWERAQTFQAKMDHLRRLVLFEPRGHRAMCAGILTEPAHPEAHAGVIFLEPIGCVPMCGHGAIALATALVQTGRVEAVEPVTAVTLDTPDGIVRARVQVEGGRPRAATIRNVASFPYRQDLRILVDGMAPLPCDIAYGGTFYAMVPAPAAGVRLVPEEADRIVEAGERIRRAILEQVEIRHPLRPGAKEEVLYIQFYDAPVHPRAHLRNAVVVAPCGIDRSPCGTGTSARMAQLWGQGKLRLGEEFVHESIVGTLFFGKLVETTRVGDREAVVPEISGRAYLTGINQLVVDPEDPLSAGFVL